MKSWPAKALLLAGAAAALAAIPALGQDESRIAAAARLRRSADPAARREESASAAHAATQQQTAPATPGGPAPGDAAERPDGNLLDVEEVALDQMLGPRPTNYFTVPAGQRAAGRPGRHARARQFRARRPTPSGPIRRPRSAALMRRLDAPLPSRWTSILLRRALLSRLDAPAGDRPGRLGRGARRAAAAHGRGRCGADAGPGGRVENYTPRMIEVAGQTALATADPAALCPLVGPARSRSNDVGLDARRRHVRGAGGRGGAGHALIDQARNQAGHLDRPAARREGGRRRRADAPRASRSSGRASTASTPGASASPARPAVEIPERLRAGAPPQIVAWLARAPMVPLEQRLAGRRRSRRALGVFSSQFAGRDAQPDARPDREADVAGHGRRAAAHRLDGPLDRPSGSSAMRGLWTGRRGGARPRHTRRSILTAGAAARIPGLGRPARPTPAI